MNKFHTVRYGTPADQKYLIGELLDTYDQIVINANIVAHMPDALAVFIIQHARNKPYFIDPQTHAFQHDVSFLESKTGKLKRSIDNLLEAYKEPVLSVIKKNRRPLLPKDLRDQAIRDSFCKNVIDFQLAAINNRAQASDAAKYYKYAQKGKTLGPAHFQPSLIVAPYFCMGGNTFKQWIELNIQCAKYTMGASAAPVAVQIVIRKDILSDSGILDDVIKEYRTISPSYFLIWIDGFSEHDASENDLDAYIDLLQKLGDKTKLIVLYGSFFSIALKRCNIVPNLAGVVHGLEYGESRDVVPVGGGIPIAKYYHPTMHKRLPFREALRVIRKERAMNSIEDFYSKVCDCPECKKVIKVDPDIDFANYGRTHPISFMRRNQPIAVEYPLPETKDHCVRHYMWCKEREYKKSVGLDQIVDDLRYARKQQSLLGLDSVSYAWTWEEMLKAHKKSGPR